jgi:uncharacterized protein (DUF433 family)
VRFSDCFFLVVPGTVIRDRLALTEGIPCRGAISMEASRQDRIRKPPGVCGGEACIRATRIPVWTLVAFRQTVDEAGLLAMYPTLERADLDAARAYAESHRNEIDRAIEENDADVPE